jgi:hypothetical protein
MSAYESIGARIAVEHATVAAVQLLEHRGIESLVLKGPAVTSLLYEPHEHRTSIDVDLLVEDLPKASSVLEEAGYARVVDWTPGMDRHAWTHAKADAVSIDLHRTVVGIDAPPSTTWSVLDREGVPGELAGAVVRMPGRPAQALLVALHAAQHGEGSEKTLGDLRRALERFDSPTWARAASLANELDALAAFSVGLGLDPRGRVLAEGLGLHGPTSRTARIRAAPHQPTALGLDLLLRLPARRRPAYLAGKVFPPADFMRDWRPIARHGRAGLAAAYAYRIGWLIVQLPGGVRAMRAGSESGGD